MTKKNKNVIPFKKGTQKNTGSIQDQTEIDFIYVDSINPTLIDEVFASPSFHKEYGIEEEYDEERFMSYVLVRKLDWIVQAQQDLLTQIANKTVHPKDVYRLSEEIYNSSKWCYLMFKDLHAIYC